MRAEELRRQADAEAVPSLDRLTLREREIGRLLAEGRSNKSASALLGIGSKTVETHRGRIMKKLDIGSIAELVRFAIRHKMIEP